MAALADWTVANGYNYPCGESVHRASKHIESDDLPACVLWPQEETATHEYGMSVQAMPVRLEVLAEIGADGPSVVQEKLLGDAIKAMSTLPPLARDIAYTGGGPVAAQDPEREITGIVANFEIEYDTMVGDPYNQ